MRLFSILAMGVGLGLAFAVFDIAKAGVCTGGLKPECNKDCGALHCTLVTLPPDNCIAVCGATLIEPLMRFDGLSVEESKKLFEKLK
jgi:hypothetical protein